MKIIEYFTHFIQLDKLDSLPQFKFIQEKTKLKPSVVSIILIVFVAILSFAIEIAPVISKFASVLIPAYFTFQVIETKVQKEYVKYIVYWIVFGIAQILLEPVPQFVFKSTFVMILKVILVIVLIHPKFNKSLDVYEKYIFLLFQKESVNQVSQPQIKNTK